MSEQNRHDYMETLTQHLPVSFCTAIVSVYKNNDSFVLRANTFKFFYMIPPQQGTHPTLAAR